MNIAISSDSVGQKLGKYMRYKIILSNTKETVTIAEDELPKLQKGMMSGGMIVFREGIVNTSYLVAVVQDHERERVLLERQQLDSKYQEPSPFAKMLAEKKRMLSHEGKADALAEASRAERVHK